MTETRRTYCGLCHPRCGVRLRVEDGRAIKVEGDPDHPITPQGQIRLRLHITAMVDPRMVDVQHGWWFPERSGAMPELFGVFESNANVLCSDAPEFCSPEIGSWPHTALLCRVQRESPSSAETVHLGG